MHPLQRQVSGKQQRQKEGEGNYFSVPSHPSQGGIAKQTWLLLINCFETCGRAVQERARLGDKYLSVEMSTRAHVHHRREPLALPSVPSSPCPERRAKPGQSAAASTETCWWAGGGLSWGVKGSVSGRPDQHLPRKAPALSLTGMQGQRGCRCDSFGGSLLFQGMVSGYCSRAKFGM